ncbi:hypothetical protein [Chitinophaga arvensicola]|uniref:Chaperone of endosialidase n=1 Tax=Chitinophaga arvensicola TaxID=29529 RepID=A0A1I0S927_9BACT|nr:hypothetical protein [Chitinophaga arvensicola]SEW52686.1 hypothetical protein SAMN04488122_5028 [Chitinophaga arvensicola]
MRRILYFILFCMTGAVSAQAQFLKVDDNSRTYYVNKPIPGQSRDAQGVDYLLLHELYTGTLLPDMHVYGKITGIRGGMAALGRKWTMEVNTSSANNSTRGSMISYNEASRLVTLVYNSKSYLAIEIANSSSLSAFSFTGYANGETLQLVTGAQVTGVAAFTAFEPIVMQGNVSIGSSSSVARLDIAGGPFWTDYSWKKSIKLYDASAIEFAGGTRSFGLGASGANLYFSHVNSNGTGIPNYFIIADGNTGNVSIGGTAPAANYKLAVEGTLGARRIKVVQNGWPDYVFHPEYQLPSLHEVEQFVKKEKHLEGIPSEKEVAENGLDLGDINHQLLKKVEELTLYIIQLNKNVESLNQKVADQQKTITVLQQK